MVMPSFFRAQCIRVSVFLERREGRRSKDRLEGGLEREGGGGGEREREGGGGGERERD